MKTSQLAKVGVCRKLYACISVHVHTGRHVFNSVPVGLNLEGVTLAVTPAEVEGSP